MTKVTLDITMSLDGFVAGPNQTVEEPLGQGGDQLHEWVYALASWREQHGETGGARSADDDVYQESVDATGAVLMGRRTRPCFSATASGCSTTSGATPRSWKSRG
jgi:hypothetical protein